MKSGRFVVGLLALVAGAASAQEITLDAPGADEEMTDFLRDAALSVTLADDGEPTPQDYVAAARADYRRLLTALYTKGYYSGAISIRVNGQEASGISPLGGPRQINSIDITVDPGPPGN